MSAPTPWLRRLAKADEDELARLRGLLDRIDRNLQRAFLESVERLKGRLDLEELARLIETGRIGEAIALVERELAQGGFARLGTAISQAAFDAGLAMVANMPSQIEVLFGPTNPAAIEVLRAYELDKIREINAGQVEAIRAVVLDGLQAGRNPLDMARDIRESIGLTAHQEKIVANFRRALQEGDGSALDRKLRDKRFDRTIARAIAGEKALSAEQIETMVARYRARWLKYRSETIGRTEALRALNRGNVEAWRQAIREGKVEAGQVVKRWVYSHDAKTRDAHRFIPGMNPANVPLEKPFESILGPIRWPGDEAAPAENVINCRCTLVIRYRPSAPAAQEPEA